MNLFKNTSIGLRLALGFGLLIVLVAVMAIGASVGLRRFDTAFAHVLGVNYVNIKRVAELNDDVGVVALAARNVILMDDAQQRTHELTTLKDTRAALDDDLHALAGLLASDDGRQRIEALRAPAEAFVHSLDAFLAAVEARDLEKAAAVLRSDLQQSQLQYMNALASFTRVQEKSMQRASGEALDGANWLQLALWAGAVAGVLLGATTSVLVTRSITRPLHQAVVALREVEAGNLAVDIHNDRSDEPGQMLTALSHTVASLRRVVERVNQSVLSVTSASSQIAAGNQDLSSRTEQQASSLQETAASMEQFNGTVQQSADHARQADALASAAREAATLGGEVVGHVVTTMNDISASSRKIADIIGVIDGIAFQTNILALNAAVEAARAGEQGRGFAVVASEVRSLAKRSGDAAREIKSLINNSVERVEVGARQVAEAGTAMDTIVDQVRKVSDLIGEISSAAAEQSTGIGQVSEAVSQMDRVTQQNAALVEQAAAAALGLSSQAEELAAAVAVFRLEPA